MLENYNLLIKHLDDFIRKFYWNRIVKGFFLFLGGLIASILFFVFIEYLAYLQSGVRSRIFLFFLIANSLSFIYLVVFPLSSLIKLGKYLSFDQAATIIGRHFRNDIDDKILNTLQLKRFLDNGPDNYALITAGIEQKSSTLHAYNFPSIIQISRNVKYFFIFLIGFGFMVTGWFFLPKIFQEPTIRLINYNVEFERPAPFSVRILNDMPLTVNRFEPFLVELDISGNVLPSEMMIVSNGVDNRMTNNRNSFSYEFRSVNDDFTFVLKSGKFVFGPYNVIVIDKPVIKNFFVNIDYPEYTGLESQRLSNNGDLIVPQGSFVTWDVFTDDTDYLLFDFTDSFIDSAGTVRTGAFNFSHLANNSCVYRLYAGNYKSENSDSLKFSLDVVPDRFPEMRIDEYTDSLLFTSFFYQGFISDDYGFTDLTFNFRVIEQIDEIIEFESANIKYDENLLNQDFYYQLRLGEYNLQPGNSIEYYFEVTDNDFYNGFKSTRSRLFSFSVPTMDQILAETISSDNQLNSGLSESADELENIQKDIDDLRNKMLESENVTWEQRDVLKELLDKQERVEKKIEEIQNENIQNNRRSNEFRDQNKDILEKQKQLENLMDEVLNDELKELYKQIQQELEMLDKDQYFDLLDKLEFELEDMETKLDRVLELFKQLQVERLLSESIQMLEDVVSDQDSLNQSVMDKGLDDESDSIQEKINQDFDTVEELLQNMEEKNSQLERPNDLENTSEEQTEISDMLDKALEGIQNSDVPSTDQSQKDASGKMKDLKNKLSQMQSSMQQQNLAEDANMLREILDNIITTSFNQENLMEDFGQIDVRDPKYLTLIQNQRKIETDLQLVKDSLNSLAKRQIQIQSIVSREIAEIDRNIEYAINNLIDRRKHTAISRQQFVMTHVNNLALLLNESLNNMQNQMQAQGESGGEPQQGQGADGMQDLRQMQEQMNKMLEELRQGHQPNAGESGQGMMGLSEQLARMAAEQEAIRNRLGEIMKEFNGGKENSAELNELLREMERSELDIVTNRITRQTQLRQERILTRLLEHERAMMEREKEERRVGETANFYDLSNPDDIFKYNNDSNSNREILKSLPPDFNAHYRSLVEKYFLNVQE